MANLWNIRNLPLPARSECKIDDRNLDLNFYQTTLHNATKSLQHPHLQAEAALLSRCIYRMKTKFRNDKGMKELQKINIGLRRYLTLDLQLALHRFSKTLPAKKSQNTLYPTLGNLDYLLTSLQGTVKLLARIAECAKYSAYYMNDRISIGQFWNVGCIALGMAARVFVLVKSAVKICCKLYDDLYGLRRFLKGTSGYEDEHNKLPEDLEKWLDDDWLFDEVVVVEDINEKLSRLRKKETDSVEFCDEYVEIDDDVDLIDEYIDITKEYGNKTVGKIDNNDNIEGITVENNYDEPTNMELKSNNRRTKSDELLKKEMKLFEEDIGEIITEEDNQNGTKKKKQKIAKKNKITKLTKIDEDIGEIIKSDDDIGEALPNLQTKHLKKLKHKNNSNAENISRKKLKSETKETNARKVKNTKLNKIDEDIDKMIKIDDDIGEAVLNLQTKHLKKLKRRNNSNDENIPRKKLKSVKKEINAHKVKNGKLNKTDEDIDEIIKSDNNIGEAVPTLQTKHLEKLKRKNNSNDENISRKKLKSETKKINARKVKNGKLNNIDKDIDKIIKSDNDIGKAVPNLQTKHLKKLKCRNNMNYEIILRKKLKSEKKEINARKVKKDKLNKIDEIIKSDDDIGEAVSNLQTKLLKKLKRKNNLKLKSEMKEINARKVKNGKKLKLISVAKNTDGNKKKTFTDDESGKVIAKNNPQLSAKQDKAKKKKIKDDNVGRVIKKTTKDLNGTSPQKSRKIKNKLNKKNKMNKIKYISKIGIKININNKVPCDRLNYDLE